jgi:transposase
MPSSSSRHPVGIDVSKATLDACLLVASRSRLKRFANTPAGIGALLTWLQAEAGGPVHVCLEATGTYHDALARCLSEAGVALSVLPSSRLPAFRASEGKRSKTDAQDAVLLAQYCQQKTPALWQPLRAEVEHLRMQLARIEDLDHMRQQERNRLENGRLDETVRAQIQQHQQQLKDWRTQMLREAIDWVQAHEDLAVAFAHLQTQKGIGALTALRLLSLLGSDGGRFASPRQVVAFVGLDVVERQSGTSVHGRGHISKQGSGAVRKWLGMCALVAKRWDPDMHQWAEELAARGKCASQIRVAIMRKLLHVAYGLLKHQQEYDPTRAFPTHYASAKELTPAA